MSKQDDVFIREFGIILGLLVIFAIIAFILGRSIAADAQEAALRGERATLERIQPIGKLQSDAKNTPAAAPQSQAAATPAPAPVATQPATTPVATAATAPASTAATQVAAVKEPAAPAASAGRSGEAVYQSICLACHVTGAANAPKTGDKAAWAPRAERGLDALVETVIIGKGGMPPNGGNPKLTKDEIRRAVQYLLEQAGLASAAG